MSVTLEVSQLEMSPVNLELANIAADYEISNRGYTSDDKANVRSIKLNGKLLSGLVTEDHYPEWKGLSFEEMYEKLLKEQQTNEEALKDLLDQLKKVSGKSLEDLDDLLDKMSDAADDAEDDSSTSSSGGGGDGSTSNYNESSNVSGVSNEKNVNGRNKVKK